MFQLIISLLLVCLLTLAIIFVLMLINRETKKKDKTKDNDLVELKQVSYTVDGKPIEAKDNQDIAREELQSIVEEFNSIDKKDSKEYKKLKLAAITQRLIKLKNQLIEK